MRMQKDLKPKIKLVETNINHIQFLLFFPELFSYPLINNLNTSFSSSLEAVLKAICDSFGSNPLPDTVLHSVSINEITTALELVCSWHPVIIQYIVLRVSFVGFIAIYTVHDSIK